MAELSFDDVKPGAPPGTGIGAPDSRPSSSKPDRGTRRVKYDALTQNDEVVLTMTTPQFLAPSARKDRREDRAQGWTNR